MLDLNIISFDKYKCFKSITVIDQIKPLNIVIGKNNIGKSSLLDIIEMCYNPTLLHNSGSVIDLDKSLSDDDIRSVFQPGSFVK